MVTSVLQDQQYISDVRSLIVDKKGSFIKKGLADVLFRRLVQRSHHLNLYGLTTVCQ